MKTIVSTAPFAFLGLTLTAMAEGDIEYGEYLGQECLTCHQLGAVVAAGGMPLITGWKEAAFVETMQDFRAGIREHEAMQMIAARLGDEEIVALAAYFATQK